MAKEEKVIVFIDGSNHYNIVKRLLPKNKPMDFNFDKFIKSIVKDRKHVRTYYYTAPLDIAYDAKGYANQQRFFDKVKNPTASCGAS